MKKHIAIDGPAGAGKSTVARILAERLEYLYVDTGAMYRALTWYFLQHNFQADNFAQVRKLLKQVDLRLEREQNCHRIFLNQQEVTKAIREPMVDQHVSLVAKIPEVRQYLRGKQRELALSSNSVTEGRDIGTVVLPEADLKIFLVALPEIRAFRRWWELKQKGLETDYFAILDNIRERDFIDSNREDSPLKQAEDAILVDTSSLKIEEVVNTLLSMVVED
ncbi:MAG: CMP/dCMP kinase [Candidatus Atribacteria bacterium]|nr:CMP/dCMP kinase [Candidatus Atribacteria bacterium]